ncbi:hypothetical protein GJV26_09015 [Massilia dura]|uniref:Uncharacterized protein n=1 Tax=Pseudoduganella dura TaxID=321982 RepID=A0A6I3X6Y8_9BURK|nr:hypothetical protein [Pseudoduganella dura]MUI12609.1 hypothetical protein [Pseudoduganella dura]
MDWPEFSKASISKASIARVIGDIGSAGGNGRGSNKGPQVLNARDCTTATYSLKSPHKKFFLYLGLVLGII